MTADPHRPLLHRPLRLALLVFLVLTLGGGVYLVLASRRPASSLEGRLQRVHSGRATPQETVQLGHELLLRNEPLKAAEMAFRARKAAPELPEAHHLLGVLYTAGGELPKAQAAFEEAVRVAPNALTPRLSLARFYVDQGNGPEALVHAQAAVNIDRNSGEAWLLAGRIQRLMESDGSAGPSFRRAISLDANLAEAHRELGTLLLDFDNYAEAVEPLERAYQLGDHSPATLALLALALTAGAGDEASFTRAEKLLQEAGQPDFPPAWLAQGLIHQRKREFEPARAAFRKVLAANARNERAQYALAMSYRDAGDLEPAKKEMRRHDELVRRRQRLKQLQQQAEAQPKAAAPRKAYGVALFEDGNFAAAEQQFKAWVERSPKDHEARQWLRRTRERLEASRSTAG